MKGRIVVKSRKSDKHGYLKFRYKDESGKEIVESLGIQIDNKKHFNPKTQRLNEWKKYPKHKNINQEIEKFLAKKESKKEQNTTEIKLINYIRKNICNELTNQSTKRTYLNLANNLESYLIANRATMDITINEINKDFAIGFRNFLFELTDKPTSDTIKKTLNRNTCHCYFNRFKAALRKIQIDKDIQFNQNIFSIVIKPSPVEKKGILSKEEIKTLINGYLIEEGQRNYSLSQIRNMFLFQILCDGIRISDLFTLRFSNFYLAENEIYISKTYIKNNKQHRIKLTKKMIAYLTPFIKDYINKYNIFPTEILSAPRISFLQNQIEDIRKRRNISLLKLKEHFTLKDEIQERIILLEDEISEHLYAISDVIEAKLKQIINEGKNADIFVFPYLDNSKFNNTTDFSQLSDEQYYTLMHKRVVYNRHLTKIIKQLGINKKITSHSARHTFTSLIVDSLNYNIFELAKALEHSNIRITDNYIQEIKNSRTETLNEKLDNIL